MPQSSFVSLVVDLGPELTNDSAPIRSRACQILAYLAQQDPLLSSATGAQLWTMLDFFASRLSDFSSLLPCLQGLTALLDKSYETLKAHQIAEHKPCGPNVVAFRAFFEHVHAQALEQQLRMLAYGLLDRITSSKCSQDLTEGQHAIEFCGGFISAMDGEKDPQCLLQALRIAARLVRRHAEQVQPLLEELFDVTACYFPVTYTPPAGDTTGITREGIAEMLHAVLAGSHHLAELLVPLLLEKLSSTRQLAKQDAIALLVAACNNYGIVPFPGSSEAAAKRQRGNSTAVATGPDTEEPLGLFTQLPMLRDAFVAELTHSQDESVHAGVMQGVSAVAAAVSRYVDARGPKAGDAWAAFVQPIFKFCLGELEKAPDSMQARVCRKGLAALSASGARCLGLVFDETMPLLLRCIDTAASPLTVTACISTIELLLLAVDPKVDFAGEGHPLRAHAQGLFDVLFSTARDDGVVQGKMKQLTSSDPARQPEQQLQQSTVPRGGAVAERRCAASRALGHLMVRPPSLLLPSGSVQAFVQAACEICLDQADSAVQSSLLQQLVLLSSSRAELGEVLLIRLQQSALALVQGALSAAGAVEGTVEQLGQALTLLVCTAVHSSSIAAAMGGLTALALGSSASPGTLAGTQPMLQPQVGTADGSQQSAVSHNTKSAIALSCSVLEAALQCVRSFPSAERVDAFLTDSTGEGCVLDALLRTVFTMSMGDGAAEDMLRSCAALERLLLVCSRHCSPRLHSDIVQATLQFVSPSESFEPPAWLGGWITAMGARSNFWQSPAGWLACVTAPLQVLPTALPTPPSASSVTAQCQFVNAVVQQALGSPGMSSPQAQVAALSVGSLVNFSFHFKAAGRPVVQAATAACSLLAKHLEESSPFCAPCLCLFTALVSALAAAGCTAAPGFIQQTARWVLQQNSTAATAAAISLRQMLDSSVVFSKTIGAVQRPLFRPRHFKAVMGTLLPAGQAATASTMSPAHLLAICSALPCLSVPALVRDFAVYKPFLLTALGDGAASSTVPLLPYCPPEARTTAPSAVDSVEALRVAALSVLYLAVCVQPALVQDCVMEVTPRLLNLARMYNSRSPLVRVLAIDTVASLAQLPHSSTFPVRGIVLQCLAECVDDAKRAVRRKAAVARGIWSMLTV